MCGGCQCPPKSSDVNSGSLRFPNKIPIVYIEPFQRFLQALEETNTEPEIPRLPSTHLDPEKVQQTVTRLRKRILGRFPGSSIGKVCSELETVCERSAERIIWIARPIWALRILRYALIGIIVVGLLVSFIAMRNSDLGNLGAVEWLQAIESAINDIVFISIGLFFIWTLESRIKRRRALRALHELRSIAHVIDMHQLTKDPDRLMEDYTRTEDSPDESGYDVFALRRYLDYCSEMLSLTSKVAALYLQSLDDATVVSTVNEIEDLTTGLSRKIWQKIDILNQDAS